MEVNTQDRRTVVDDLTFENLVFEGGGIKGVAYIGALKALNKLNKIKFVKRTIGTSVGSIFATLAAMKCNDDEIDKIFTTFFSEMVKINDNILDEGKNLIEGMGLHENENIYDATNSMLEDRYSIKNMTFKQFNEKSGVDLTIVGTCLSTRSITYFNHNDYPDMELAKAIQISTSIPFFYTITKWNGKVWADGGIVENFPIEYYDSENGTFNYQTLGFLLEYDDGKNQFYKIDSIVDLLEGIENTELDNNIRQSIAKSKNRFIVDINTGLLSSLKYNLSTEEMDTLKSNGYNSTMEFFTTVDDSDDDNTDVEKVTTTEPVSYGFFWDTLYRLKPW